MVVGYRIFTFTVKWVSLTTTDIMPVSGLRAQPDLLTANPICYIRIGRHGQSDALLLPAHKVSRVVLTV